MTDRYTQAAAEPGTQTREETVAAHIDWVLRQIIEDNVTEIIADHRIAEMRADLQKTYGFDRNQPSMSGIRKRLKELRRRHEQRNGTRPVPSGALPVIRWPMVNDYELNVELTTHLRQARAAFCYGGASVVVRQVELPAELFYANETASIERQPISAYTPIPLNVTTAKGILSQHFEFWEQGGGDKPPKQIPVPQGAAQAVVEYAGVGLAPLRKVINHPTAAVDGPGISVLNPGYDDHTGLFVTPEASTPIHRWACLDDAVAFLRDAWLGEVDWADPADFWRALSVPLTLVARPTLLGSAGGLPLTVITAPSSASGKTELAIALCQAVTGRIPPATGWPERNDEELEKRLISAGLSSTDLMILDNIRRGEVIRSSVLEAWTTSDFHKGRRLGKSEAVEVYTFPVICTGNNIAAGGDLSSRCIVVRLLPRTAVPSERAFCRNLRSFTRTNRPQILGALDLILRQADPARAPRSRYTIWARTIGSALVKVSGEPTLFAEWSTLAEGEGTHATEIFALVSAMEAHFEKYPPLWRTGMALAELRGEFPDELAELLGYEGDTAIEDLKKTRAGSSGSRRSGTRTRPASTGRA